MAVCTTLTVGKPAPAAFSVESISVSPSSIKPGETATITVVVKNTGGTAGSAKVTITDETYRAEITALDTGAVSAGETKTLTARYGPYDVGDHSICAAIGASRKCTTLTVTAVPKKFEVTSITLSKSSITLGESVGITVVTKNVGDVGGQAEVAVTVDGVELKRFITAWIGPGITASSQFAWTPEKEGTFRICADVVRAL
jgi:uncharacterized membrane protein